MTTAEQKLAKQLRKLARPLVFVTSSARTAKEATYTAHRTLHTDETTGQLYVEFDGSTFWVEPVLNPRDSKVMYYRSTSYRASKDPRFC